jgi:uncharacterized protein YndB with AHSA1/START domain
MPVQRSAGDPIPAGDEVVSRVFGAPRGLVFEVWTKAEHFTRWFGPHGAEVFSCEIDARPGGVIRFGHRLPGGMALRSKGTFVEVVLDERLVFTLGVVDERGHPVPHPMFPDWPLDVLIEMTVTLEDVGEGTRVTVAHRVLPPHAAHHPATKRWFPLALEGSRQVLDRLGEHLSLAPPRAAGEARNQNRADVPRMERK